MRFALANAGNLNGNLKGNLKGKLNATPNDITQLAKNKMAINDFIFEFKLKIRQLIKFVIEFLKSKL